MSKCEGWVGKIFGHYFQEAVNEEDIGTIPKDIAETEAYLVNTDAMFEACKMRKKTVVAIYCTRCGEQRDIEKRSA